MIKVNLLPQELRKKRKVPFFDKYFLYVFVCLVVGLVVLWFQTQQQQNEIETLQNEIARVESEIQRFSQQVSMVEQVQELRDKIATRIEAIKMLEIQRPFWVKTFEEFASLIPEFLWISEFVEVEKIVTVKGISYNLKGIANFIAGLINSEYFDDIKLNYIREQNTTSEGVTQYSFELSGNVVFATAEKYAGEFIGEEEINIKDELPPISSKVVPLGREALEQEKNAALDAVKKAKQEKPEP
ncbi:PilN domain-containing protein [bacterium]|nr:PilN domain-containing protein [bacterium]